MSGDTKLVVELENPPRTRVVLSIDNAAGTHYELVWDPEVNDSLQKSVVLPMGNWTLTPSSDYERVTTDNHVVTYGTTFTIATAKGAVLAFEGENVAVTTPAPASCERSKPCFDLMPGKPRLEASCQAAKQELRAIHLDRRKVVAAAVGRSLLDATVPKSVEATFALLAEIAVDRARSGAMELIREKFVAPLCNELTLATFRIGTSGEPAFPRTCTFLQHLRLEDALGSGRALLSAVEADVRDTLVPAMVARLPFVNEQSRTIVDLAMRLANAVFDRRTDGVIEIDYLIALLDNLSWATGFDHDLDRIEEWVVHALPTDPTNQALMMEVLRRTMVQLALPEDFDALDQIENRPWKPLAECNPRGLTITMTGAFAYRRANRDTCITAIMKLIEQNRIASGATWIGEGINREWFKLADVIAAVRSKTQARPFDQWLDVEWFKKKTAEVASKPVDQLVQSLQESISKRVNKLPPTAKHAIAASCTARLVIGIAKWCSAKDEPCTAGEISSMLRSPTTVFAPTLDRLPEAICWKTTNEYRLAPEIDRYLDLGARLITFLLPAAKGDERARTLAMIAWMFDMIVAVDGGSAPYIAQIDSIIEKLVEKDYISALAGTLELARDTLCKRRPARVCEMPKSATKALQLIGAVASYARTYEDTKDLDPAAAKEARRKALESLIDAATDRRNRGRDLVVSLGSNVAIGWSRNDVFETNEKDEVAVRVPLGVSLQYLPRGSQKARVESRDVWRYFGLHAALQAADLGNFLRNTGDEGITWSAFVAPGIEAGILIGEPNRTFTLTGHLSYVPTLTDDAPAQWRVGVSFGYYVPFFDFN